MDRNELLELGYQAMVPDGNPIAEYLDQRSAQYGQTASDDYNRFLWSGGLALGGAEVAPPLAALLGVLSLANGVKAAYNKGQQGFMQDGSDMWANRFGNGNPNQGMPGTPSGPAWRR